MKTKKQEAKELIKKVEKSLLAKDIVMSKEEFRTLLEEHLQMYIDKKKIIK